MSAELVPNPRKNVETVFAYWTKNRSKTVGPVSTNGEVVFSYSQPLLARHLRDGRMTGYVFLAKREKGRYSVTTAQHLTSLHQLIGPYRLDPESSNNREGWIVVEVSPHDLEAIVRGDKQGAEELIIRALDAPLRQNPVALPIDEEMDRRAERALEKHASTRTRRKLTRRVRDLDSFEANPPWVTKIIADSLVGLQDSVPPSWLPKFDVATAGKGNVIRAEIAEYGCGAYGCVMPTVGDRNVVLKLTSDPSEAKFALEIAETLPTPCVVRYHLAVMIEGVERHGREVFLLWRESAEQVGRIHKVVGMHAEKAIRKQHRAALDAYIALAEGDEDAYFELLEVWKKRCMEMARVPELEFVAIGMLRAWNERGVFISDTHGGNLGLAPRNGKPTWVITDPGNVVVSRAHADERSRLRTKRTVNPPKPRCPIDHQALKRDDIRWQALKYVGRQQSWDDDGSEIWLELRDCSCGSTLARELKDNPICPKRGAQRFFEEHAGWGWRPGHERPRDGRTRSGRNLAIAEYVLEEEHPDAEVRWEIDEDARAFWGPQEPEVEEYYWAGLYEDGEVLASLGGIGDPDSNYRRIIEAELAYEAWNDRVQELAQELEQRHGRPLRMNPAYDPEIDQRDLVGVMNALMRDDTDEHGGHPGLTTTEAGRLVQAKDKKAATLRCLNYLYEMGLVDKGASSLVDEAIWTVTDKAKPHDFYWPTGFLGVDVAEELTKEVLPNERFHAWIESFQGEGDTWRAHWEYPGFLSIHHPASEIEIVVGVGDERTMMQWPYIDIQIQSTDGSRSYPNGLTMPFPRSPAEFVALIQPLIDKYHP